MNTQERKNDLLRIIEQLDITPTMYKNAEEKYKNLAAYLESKGIEADMYPQGSFALGTVIRPTVRDPNAGYDLDFVCQVHAMREDTTPAELRKLIEDALTSSDLYGGKLTIYDECFTVTYANIGNNGFSIDIVPAVDESEQVKARLQQKATYPDLISTSIAIPKKEPDVYTWLTVKIDAVIENLSRARSADNIIELQKLINKRRAIPVLERNSIHKSNARKLSELYKTTNG